MEDVTRCTRCVLPDSARFPLDARGTCSLCHAAKAEIAPRPSPAAPERDLEQQIQAVREGGRGRRFDCVVGLSGGRDSTYLLSLLVRKHGLRCLAAHYRTPFTPEATSANVGRVVATLDVPLVNVDLPQEEHRRFARELVQLWLRRPDPVVANLMCAPCKLVNRELFRIARAHGVRTVVAGANVYESVQVAASIPTRRAAANDTHLGLRSQVQVSALLARKGVATLARNLGLLRHLRRGVQGALMYVNLHTPYLRARYPEIQVLEYFYFAPWEERACERAIAEVGWRIPPGCASTWKTDCTLAEIKNFAFKQTTGVTYYEAFLSNQVRAGAVDRAEALRRLQVQGAPSTERLEHVCRVLDLPPAAFGPSHPTDPAPERTAETTAA